MPRHDFDATSFVAGIVFAVLGGLFLLESAAGVDVDLRWIAPVLLIGLGVAGLASALRSTRLEE